MKKFKNFFLMMMLVCLGAFSASAAKHDITMMVDNASNLTVKHASSSSTNPFGTVISGTAVSGVQSGIHEYSIGNDYLLIAFSNKTAPAAVYVNGTKQTTTTASKATFYRIQLSGSPIMVEVYTTSDANKYEYDLDVEISDDSEHVTSFRNNGSGATYSAPYSGVKF